MSRIIKFRCYIPSEGYHYFKVGENFFWKGLVVEQFTGLLDKNGKEIYENDVVLAGIYTDEIPQSLTVTWRNGGFIIDYEDSESDCVLVGEFVGSLEVIGNIYETELMEDHDESY